MARLTMALVISRLRGMTDAATDDEFNGVTYWTDDQLQTHLDANSAPKADLTLTAGTMLVSGVADWRTQYFERSDAWAYEDTAQVVDSNGYPLNEDYFTIDWQRKTITLTSDVTTNQAYFLRVTLYDMWNAAAAVWAEKVNQRVSYTASKYGGHSLHLEQEYAQCVNRLNYYRGLRLKRFKHL